MSVTGTTTFTVTRDNIIQYALRKIGVLELGVTPDSTTVTNAAFALNMMIKSWITKGIKLWTEAEITVPLTVSKTSYIIGNTGTTEFGTPDVISHKPMKITQAWLRNTTVSPQNDIPIQVISHFNYNEFGSKFSTGTSNSVYVHIGRDQAQVNLYLTPDTTAATTYQLHLSTQRQLFDMSAAGDNFDFPAEWYYALGWNLALELATDNSVDAETFNRVAQMAMKTLSEVEDFDREDTSIYFTPDSRGQK